jgi:LmbE family N-acetylglucosaminyl deacetylase
LGLVVETDSRDALSFFGINHFWFLNGVDGSQSESVLESLERWDHASLLEQAVRIIRPTRPEAIITWLPMVVAG